MTKKMILPPLLGLLLFLTSVSIFLVARGKYTVPLRLDGPKSKTDPKTTWTDRDKVVR